MAVISASNAVNLPQAELMDLIRRHVRGGAAVDIVFVALHAIRQGSRPTSVVRPCGAYSVRRKAAKVL